jgi:HK97 family phage major capsid protein
MEKEELELLLKTQKDYTDTSVSELKEKNEAIQKELKELTLKFSTKLKEDENKVKGFNDVLAKEFESETFKKYQEIAKDNRNAGYSFRVKNETFTFSNSIAESNTAGITFLANPASITGLPSQKYRLRDFFTKVPAVEGIAYYTTVTSVLGSYSVTGQTMGQSKPLNSYDIQSNMKKLDVIAGIYKIPSYFVKYGKSLMSFYQTDVPKQYFNNENSYIVNSTNGLWNSGVLCTYSGATLGGIVASGTTITALDRIGAGYAQLTTASYSPDLILVSCADAVKLRLLKDSNQRYQLSEVNGVLSFMGIPIVASEAFSVGNAMILDSSYIEFHEGDSLKLEFGYDADDFSKNLVTLRAEADIYLAVKNSQAIVKLAI